MKIESQYAAIINKFLSAENEKAPAEKQQETKNNAGVERTETSQLLSTVSKELERLDQQENPERAEYLEELQNKINEGNYQVDPQEVASAMLRSKI